MWYPKMHISIRVPWHDSGWDGRVCSNPRLNGACLKLKSIGEKRNDDAEELTAGKTLEELSEREWPCCVAERSMFMAPFEYTRNVNHPYKNSSENSHGHFDTTPLRHPPYSAPAVPFAWMLRESFEELVKLYGLDIRLENEPKLDFDTQWIQSLENQKLISDCFCEHIKPKESLCFFYAKQVPFVEDTAGRRVLIGVGRVLHVAPAVEYNYTTKNLKGKLRSMLWERVIQHSIRPDFKDGFLLPYHAALALAANKPDFSPASIVAFSPNDRLLEFSHASQLVTHDAAIASLLSCATALKNASGVLPGPWEYCLKWIDSRISELWTARGPCPGLASALRAFGLDRGTFIARYIFDSVGENADPWPFVDIIFKNPKKYLPKDLAIGIEKSMQNKWLRLPEERRNLLKLISRFEISIEQAEKIYIQELRKESNIDCSDNDILNNPYLLYETTRLTSAPISLWTIDRGVFPDETIRKKHPLPKPTALNSGTDARRLRSLIINTLEDATCAGNSLLPQEQIVLAIRKLNIRPGCDVDGDLINVTKDQFKEEIIETDMTDGSPALQLARLEKMDNVIRFAIKKRIKGKRLVVDADWKTLLDKYLNIYGECNNDELEEKAREEKTAALKELAESRISVLVGPAGTGKTTLLSVLCSQPQISQGGILLLAPTGKARVRMEQAVNKLNLNGQTVAQFLTPNRYDVSTGRYKLSEIPAEVCARTVIVDEASMLTEEMLAALIQALRGVHRLILIGDPRQLPPIGVGRPFVDVIKYITSECHSEKFPHVAPGYAELTIRRRQVGEEREDLQLAEWFSGSTIAPGEDDIFDKVVKSGESKHIRMVQWDSYDQLREKLLSVLVDELRLNGPDDIQKFDESLGGKDWNGIRFFNLGSAIATEGWQILSPVRSSACGVTDVNRLIHKQFRQGIINASRAPMRKYPKPMGPEEIVYGDKVINLANTSHRRVYPKKLNPYIANGEIGMTVGYYKKNGAKDFRWKLEVEFSSQPNFKYDFTAKDFGEEDNPILELAYALTVHKSQGSEFGTVILILPNPCRLLSRELLYTALTRHKNRVVILHQGDRSNLRSYSFDDKSETARRLTNLFQSPSPKYINEQFFEENLIHRTAHGEMVRSKSEVIIADRLFDLNVEYMYEHPLTIGCVTKYPDFTIEDSESGRTFYWEHCGMLHVPNYRRRWEEKLKWYKDNGILPYEEGGGDHGTLIITRESERGGISSQDIEKVIRKIILD